MKLLSLGLTGTTDDVRNRLQQDCWALSQEGFRVAVDEIYKGKYTFIGCNIIEGELSFRNYERIKNLLKHFAAKILADLILLQEERVLVRKIIDTEYDYFNEQERTTICENALKMLASDSGLYGNFDYNARRNNVLSAIVDYLDTNHELVVEGFITFRLKDYRRMLSDAVDKAVDELMMEQEYQEFIRVLRYFVDIQECQVDEVHVVISDSGKFKILDAQGEAVNSYFLDNFAMQSADNINYEDLLITALITIAPQSVMLHNVRYDKRKDIVNTITNIFDGRVIFCHGCDVCQT